MGNGISFGSFTTYHGLDQSLLAGTVVKTSEPHPPPPGHASKPVYVGTLIPLSPDWSFVCFHLYSITDLCNALSELWLCCSWEQTVQDLQDADDVITVV